jgi:hypothetical protein
MKSFRRLSWGNAVALAAAVLLCASTQAETKHNRAVIRAVHGSAQVSNNKGQSWSPARVGTFLGANSVVRTATDGTVDLFLGDNGPVVRVTPDTSLGIDRLDLDNTGVEKVIETQLDLKNGRILGSVKKMAAASKYEVKTPVGVAGIRGTEYDIDSRGKVTIVTGAAVVVYVINGTILPPVNVGTGQTVTPPTGGGQPTVSPYQGGGDVSLLQGVTTDNGRIIVTMQNGGTAGTTVDGITVVNGGPGPGGEVPPTLAPSPEGIVHANPNHLPDETENLVNGLSPSQPQATDTQTSTGSGVESVGSFGAGVTATVARPVNVPAPVVPRNS